MKPRMATWSEFVTALHGTPLAPPGETVRGSEIPGYNVEYKRIPFPVTYPSAQVRRRKADLKERVCHAKGLRPV